MGVVVLCSILVVWFTCELLLVTDAIDFDFVECLVYVAGFVFSVCLCLLFVVFGCFVIVLVCICLFAWLLC